MMKPDQFKKAGGAAFPTFDGDTYDGMTLRDYFAACAMRLPVPPEAQESAEDIANWCYEVADAMLIRREEYP